MTTTGAVTTPTTDLRLGRNIRGFMQMFYFEDLTTSGNDALTQATAMYNESLK